MLNTLKVIRQCLLRSAITNCLKSTPKYGKRVRNLLYTKFDTKPVLGDNDKFKKTKIEV